MNEISAHRRRRPHLWMAGVFTVMLAACSSTPPPREHLSLAEAAVDGAVSAGAAELAPQELLRARNKLEAAKEAMEVRKYPRAQVMAEQAEVDGVVARNKAAQERSRRALLEVQQGLQTLRQQGTFPAQSVPEPVPDRLPERPLSVP